MRYDLHTHSTFSFDGHFTPEEMVLSAIDKGLDAIAITDHLDVDGNVEGYYTPYRMDEARTDVLRVKEKYNSKIKVLYGVELGQPYTHPVEAKRYLDEHNFDFIIGSLHNLVKCPDFCCIDFSNMDNDYMIHLWKRYLGEINTLLLDEEKNPCNFTTLGHLTYPIRYIKKAGKELDIKPYYDTISEIYCKIIKRGIALEINSSGLRQGAGETFPNEELLRLYRECNGKYVTIGSDAHFAQDIGADIDTAFDLTENLGLTPVELW